MSTPSTSNPIPTYDEYEIIPAKKVTITDRDDAYLATLLDPGIADVPIEVIFDGDNIFNFTPPVPASTREWLLLALAKKLNKYSSVGAPEKLDSTDSLETAIETINSIINCLIDAGVFRIAAIHVDPGELDPGQPPVEKPIAN